LRGALALSASCRSSPLSALMPSDPSVCRAQVVWTGGDKSTSLWCSYSGAFLGTIDRGKELGLPESSSFSRDSQRSLADEWRAKVDTNKVRPTPISDRHCLPQLVYKTHHKFVQYKASFMPSFLHSIIHTFVHYSFIRLSLHSSIYSLFHAFIHCIHSSCIHAFVCSSGVLL